jgi:hypothetical protein
MKVSLYKLYRQFAATFTKEFNRLLCIKSSLSTAYHLQTDSQMECVNQEMKIYLHIFNYHQNDWTEWLSLATFWWNAKINPIIKLSPFEMAHRWNLLASFQMDDFEELTVWSRR